MQSDRSWLCDAKQVANGVFLLRRLRPIIPHLRTLQSPHARTTTKTRLWLLVCGGSAAAGVVHRQLWTGVLVRVPDSPKRGRDEVDERRLLARRLDHPENRRNHSGDSDPMVRNVGNQAGRILGFGHAIVVCTRSSSRVHARLSRNIVSRVALQFIFRPEMRCKAKYLRSQCR